MRSVNDNIARVETMNIMVLGSSAMAMGQVLSLIRIHQEIITQVIDTGAVGRHLLPVSKY